MRHAALAGAGSRALCARRGDERSQAAPATDRRICAQTVALCFSSVIAATSLTVAATHRQEQTSYFEYYVKPNVAVLVPLLALAHLSTSRFAKKTPTADNRSIAQVGLDDRRLRRHDQRHKLSARRHLHVGGLLSRLVASLTCVVSVDTGTVSLARRPACGSKRSTSATSASRASRRRGPTRAARAKPAVLGHTGPLSSSLTPPCVVAEIPIMLYYSQNRQQFDAVGTFTCARRRRRSRHFALISSARQLRRADVGRLGRPVVPRDRPHRRRRAAALAFAHQLRRLRRLRVARQGAPLDRVASSSHFRTIETRPTTRR